MRALAAKAPICWRTAPSSMAGRPPLLCRRATSTSRCYRVAPAAAAADAGTLLGQAGAGDPPALAGSADHVGGGDPHLVEEDLVEVGRPRHLAQRSDVDTGAAHVENEGRDAGRTLDRLGARQQVAVVGPLGPRAPDLLTRPRRSRRRRAVARVWSEVRSLPASGSLKSWVQMWSPRAIGGRYSARCSSVPKCLSAPATNGLPSTYGTPAAPSSCSRMRCSWGSPALGREAVDDVAGVIDGTDVVAQELDIVGAVGHAQAGSLLPLQCRLVRRRESPQRRPDSSS